MVNHRDQAKHDRAGWRLIVLAPAWMAQISLLIILISTGSYMLSIAVKQSVELRGTVVAWEAINIIVGTLSILLTAYEIFRMATESLTPKILVVCNTIKLFGIVLGMIMDGMATGTSLNSWADGTLVVHAFLVLSVFILCCYAAWKWKRLAQYDDYHHPGNVKPFGFKSDLKQNALRHSRGISDDLDWDLEMGNTVEISSPGIMAVSPGEPSPDATRPRGSSFTKLVGKMNFSLTNDVDAANASGNRSRSSSGAALMNVDTAYDPAATQGSSTDSAEQAATVPQRPRAASYISFTGEGSNRRASYNHTRDTAFDDYVAQNKGKKRASQRISSASYTSQASSSDSASSRHSTPATANPYRISLGLSLKNDLDDALSAEFGWGNRSRSSSQDSEMAGGKPPAIAVAGGPVPGAKNVRDSLGRAPSDGSERAAVDNVPEGEDEAEEEEERNEEDRRKKNVDEASRALLGQAADEGISHPDSLRPHRPISVVITPPPKSPTGDGNGDRNMRMTWGSAYSRS